MGLMTLEQLRTEVRFDLKNRTDTGPDGVSDARLNMWINDALQEFTYPSVSTHDALRTRFTLPLVAGQYVYDYSPTPAGEVVHVLRYAVHYLSNTDDPLAHKRTMNNQDEQWFEKRTITTGGPPSDYATRDDKKLIISPVPSTAYAGNLIVLGAWREHVEMTADDQKSELKVRWDEVIILGARWRAELHLGYRDLSDATKLDYTSLVNQYKQEADLHFVEDWSSSTDMRTDREAKTA